MYEKLVITSFATHFYPVSVKINLLLRLIMAVHNDFGKEGEELAACCLQQKGYTILERNWRSGHKEIDIVARKDNLLVIVEVKTRGGTDFGEPENAVTNAKIRRLVSAADAYVRHNRIDMPVRFDIITIVRKDGRQQVEHIEDAFFPPIWN